MRVFSLMIQKDDLVDLRLCFSICVSYLLNDYKLHVSIEVFSRRDGVICWMVCIGSVVI